MENLEVYDKAISLRVSRSIAVMFTDKQLKATAQLHIMEGLIKAGHPVDNITKYHFELDREESETKDTVISVRAKREVDGKTC